MTPETKSSVELDYYELQLLQRSLFREVEKAEASAIDECKHIPEWVRHLQGKLHAAYARYYGEH